MKRWPALLLFGALALGVVSQAARSQPAAVGQNPTMDDRVTQLEQRLAAVEARLGSLEAGVNAPLLAAAPTLEPALAAALPPSGPIIPQLPPPSSERRVYVRNEIVQPGQIRFFSLAAPGAPVSTSGPIEVCPAMIGAPSPDIPAQMLVTANGRVSVPTVAFGQDGNTPRCVELVVFEATDVTVNVRGPRAFVITIAAK